jgi:hypothetical protein
MRLLQRSQIGINRFIGGKPAAEGTVDLQNALLKQFGERQRDEFERAPYFAYAHTKFVSAQRRRALLLFGCNDRISIWLNGKRVVTESAPGEGRDRQTAEAALTAGENEVLIKAATGGGRLSFFFRIADEDGRPFDDLRRE